MYSNKEQNFSSVFTGLLFVSERDNLSHIAELVSPKMKNCDYCHACLNRNDKPKIEITDVFPLMLYVSILSIISVEFFM